MIAFDPGLTTGYCVVQYDPTEADPFNLHVISCGAIEWTMRHETIPQVLNAPAVFKRNLLALVVEKFRLYPEKAQSLARNDFPSAIVEGIIEHAAYREGILGLLVYYNAANRLGVQVLPQHQAVIGKVQHKIDAYQHARYHLIIAVQKKLKLEQRKQELTRAQAAS